MADPRLFRLRVTFRETVAAGHATEMLRPITFLRIDQRAAEGI